MWNLLLFQDYCRFQAICTDSALRYTYTYMHVCVFDIPNACIKWSRSIHTSPFFGMIFETISPTLLCFSERGRIRERDRESVSMFCWSLLGHLYRNFSIVNIVLRYVCTFRLLPRCDLYSCITQQSFFVIEKSVSIVTRCFLSFPSECLNWRK